MAEDSKNDESPRYMNDDEELTRYLNNEAFLRQPPISETVKGLVNGIRGWIRNRCEDVLGHRKEPYKDSEVVNAYRNEFEEIFSEVEPPLPEAYPDETEENREERARGEISEERRKRKEFAERKEGRLKKLFMGAPPVDEGKIMAEVHEQFGLQTWMSAERIIEQLNLPENKEIEDHLKKALNYKLLDAGTLQANPVLRYSIALLLHFKNKGKSLENVTGVSGNIDEATDEEIKARKKYSRLKKDLNILENAHDNCLKAARELSSLSDDLGSYYENLKEEIGKLKKTEERSAGEEADLKEKEKAMAELNSKKSNLKLEFEKMVDVLKYATTHPSKEEPFVKPNDYINNIVNKYDDIRWDGKSKESWKSIQETGIHFVSARTLEADLDEIIPEFDKLVNKAKEERGKAEKKLKETKETHVAHLTPVSLLHNIWSEIYKGESDPEKRKSKALFAAMVSISKARDQQLLDSLSEIRKAEMNRTSSWFCRRFKYGFAPSAKTMLDRIRHVKITKESRDIQPFAKLDFQSFTSRDKLREAIQKGKLAEEDVPRLYLHLEAILKNFKEHPIKPQDAAYLVNIIQNLKIIRAEKLHKEVMEQYRNAERTPAANMVKLMETKVREEEKWEKQMADDILRGEFLRTIKPWAVWKEKRAAYNEIAKKMKDGEWGYGDAVRYMEEKGFPPGTVKKAHLIGRKFKNWLTPRKKEEGRPGLLKKTGKLTWKVGKAPFKLMWGAMWPVRKVLNVGLGVALMPVKGVFKWIGSSVKGFEQKYGLVKG